ncbi:MAG: rod shape-determining protein MreC [Kiritimatiellae bacterium]|nr:rod shape-determining protein MreC [Kiritimatiellia bacterium]
MKGRTGIIIAAAALGAVAVLLFGARGTAAEAVYPVENGRNWLSRNVGTRLRGLFSRMDLAAENRRLKEENAALRMELSSSVAPGARRRPPAAAALPLAPGATWIPAPVLSRSGTVGVSGIMRLGKGSLAGVKAGAPVAAPEGLVGRVLAVTPHTCDVRLIIDPSMRVSCEIEPPDPSDGPIYGILYGGGATCVAAEADASILYVVNPLRMRHMQRRLDLPPRSKIITSGLGGIFPRGLVVGFLLDGQHIDETRLEREGDVVAAVDFPALENVFIRRED